MHTVPVHRCSRTLIVMTLTKDPLLKSCPQRRQAACELVLMSYSDSGSQHSKEGYAQQLLGLHNFVALEAVFNTSPDSFLSGLQPPKLPEPQPACHLRKLKKGYSRSSSNLSTRQQGKKEMTRQSIRSAGGAGFGVHAAGISFWDMSCHGNIMWSMLL